MFWTLVAAAALTFPNIQARDLDGHAVTPASLQGKPAVLLLGFSYGSRVQVEAWATALEQGAAPHPTVVQVPVYHRVPTLARGFIDGAMARNTPAVAHAHVWTTDAYEPLVQALHLGDPGDDGVAVLLDARGRVACLERGQPRPAALKRLLDAWRAL